MIAAYLVMQVLYLINLAEIYIRFLWVLSRAALSKICTILLYVRDGTV